MAGLGGEMKMRDGGVHWDGGESGDDGSGDAGNGGPPLPRSGGEIVNCRLPRHPLQHCSLGPQGRSGP